MKYKGFKIQNETERWFGSERPVTKIYDGDRLIARVADNAAKHVVDKKLESGEWTNREEKTQ